MKKLISIMLCVLIVTSLVGCGGRKQTVQEIKEKLLRNGLPEKSLRETEGKLYDEIRISDSKLGYASIRVYKSEKEAKNAWNSLDERYNNLNYVDDQTATGDLKDVCDASIQEWIYRKDNVVASVEEIVTNEWAIYVGEDGQEYYGDGTPVESGPTPNEQRNKAKRLEKIIMNSLE